MSRTEIVILNSSSPVAPLLDFVVTPPPPSDERVVPSTSSPDSLPSPLAVLTFNLDRRLKTGSHASKILEGTRVGFTSVSGLVKTGQFHAGDGSKRKPTQDEPESSKGGSEKWKANETSPQSGKLKKPSKHLEPRRSPEKGGISWELEDGEKSEDGKASSATRAEKSTSNARKCSKSTEKQAENVEGVIVKKTSMRSKQECKSADPTDQLQPGNQNEAEVVTKAKPKKKSKSTGKSSRYFAENNMSNDAKSPQSPSNQDSHPTLENAARVAANNPAGLMPPPKRRLNWTPPQDTVQVPNPQESPVVDLQRASLSPTSLKLDFSTLLQNFVNNSAENARKPVSVAVPQKRSLKRKRIELIEAATTAATSSQKESPVEPVNFLAKRKTKLTSITSIATERFRTTNEPPPLGDGRVSKFLAPGRESSKSRSTSPAKAAVRETKANRRQKRVDATGEESGAKSRKANAKRPTFKQPPLLKPEQAAQHFARHEEKHDFVFGTFSQFHRERSPTMLRAIQRTIRESEIRDSLEFVNIEAIEGRAITGKSGLWAAASKVEDDSMLTELHTKELTGQEKHQTGQDQDSSQVILSHSPKTTEDLPQADAEVFLVGETCSGKKHISAEDYTAPATEPRPQFNAHTYVTTTQSFSAVPQKCSMSPASRPIVSASSPGQVAFCSLSTNASPQKRGRGRPPKEKASDGAGQPVAPGVKASAKPVAKRPRGRPRKDDADESMRTTSLENHERPFKDISEIEDSEAESTPTPPRRRQKTAASSQLYLASSQEIANVSEKNGNGNGSGNGLNRLKAKHPKWTEISNELFPRITEVVKGAPRGEVGKPSWWEKMLMYDPIVIEDLTAWLEEQGVRVPGYSEGESEGGKLKAWMVRKWCEDKSVCCLWREGLRSGVKYQY